MAQFPDKIAELHNPNPNKTLGEENHADIETKQNEEIIAIETNLGLGGIAGTKENLKERLAVSIDNAGKLKTLVYSEILKCFLITKQED